MTNDPFSRQGERTDPGSLPHRQLLYLQVYEILLNRIESGAIATGAYLPNEFDLSREYRVSVGTIRKAIDLLVDEKLVIRQQGRGTIVTDDRWAESSRKIDRFRDREGQIISQWQTVELAYDVIPADETVARQLKISAGDRVQHVHRLRTAPQAWQIAERIYWPARLIPVERLEPEDRRETDKLIRKYGLVIGAINEKLHPVTASDPAAADLGLAAETPLIKSERILVDREGAPFEYRVMLGANDEGAFWSASA